MIRSLSLALLVALPAHAEVIAYMEDSTGARLEIHDNAGGLCLGDAKLAIYSDGKGKTTPGCWTESRGTIGVNWLDGDRGDIPKQMLKKPQPV